MTEEQKEENPDDMKFFDELHLEDFQDYEDLFSVVTDYKNGKVDKAALKEKLFELRFRKLSDEDLDKILAETEFLKDGKVSVFNCLIFLKKIIDAGTKEKLSRFSKRSGSGLFRERDPANYKRKARPYSDSEKNKYAKMINKLLKDDPDCKGKIPIDPSNDELFDKLKDGVILCKLCNLAEPGTIPEDAYKKNDDMNVYDKYDNLKKAVDGAQKVGCRSETTPDDVLDGDKGRDEDLVGQLLARINLPKQKIRDNPETDKLLQNGETRNDVAELPLDDFLKRWFNDNLTKAGHPDKLDNFNDDVKDSTKYTVLLNQLDPTLGTAALKMDDPNARAAKTVSNAKNYGAETVVGPKDITDANDGLNRLFTTDIYNATLNQGGDDNYDKDVMKAYVKEINKLLCDDAGVKNKVPIDPETEEVFDKVADGSVVGKLVNLADKDALPEDNIVCGDNVDNDDVCKNWDNAVDGAKKIGCAKAKRPKKKKQHQELLGDILGKINASPDLVKKDPEADKLLNSGETKDDLANLPTDDFLKRWFNSHLKNAGCPNEVTSFGPDLADGEKLAIVLNDIAPTACNKDENLAITDPAKRNDKNIADARKIGLDTSLTGDNVADGRDDLNTLLVAQLYNAYQNPFNVNEKECYCKIINKLLKDDPDVKDKLPIDPKTNEVFKKLKDGEILSKLVNLIVPDTIDQRVIAKGPDVKRAEKESNVNLTLNAAKGVGCIFDTTTDDVLCECRGNVIDLLFQILKPILFKKVGIQECPQLFRLKGEKEEKEDLLTLGPEDLLMRWFNYHLKNAKHPDAVTNWGDDVKDSVKYTHLLNQLSPDCDKSALDEPDLVKRGEAQVKNGEKIGADVNILPEDIPSGNEHLNLVFTTELFNANHGMGEPTQEEKMQAAKLLEDDDEGDREERAFRTWINSLKLDDVKKVNNLYQECRSAILLLKIIDKVKPGTVNWKVVELHTKNPFKIQVNCNEAIDASKKSGYHIVGIGGADIREGNKKYILAIVWQLMRAHTLKVIGGKSEEELLKWANGKVSEPLRVKTLKDKRLNSSMFWIELLAGIEPKCIRWDIVVKEPKEDKEREMNAKYALSVARGLGACVFVVWEDLTQVKDKLLLTFLASIYDAANSRGQA